MTFVVLGGADRPPQPAAPISGFVAVNNRLRELRTHYAALSRLDIAQEAKRNTTTLSVRVMTQFRNFGGEARILERSQGSPTFAVQAYLSLKETSRLAEGIGDRAAAAAIRESLAALDKFADEQFRALSTKYDIAAAPPTQSPPQAEAPVAVNAIDLRKLSLSPFDWVAAYRQLYRIGHHFSGIGSVNARCDFQFAVMRASDWVRDRFTRLGGQLTDLPPLGPDVASRAEQNYRAIEAMSRQAEASGEFVRQYRIHQNLNSLHDNTSKVMAELAARHGALEALALQAHLVTAPSPLESPATLAPAGAPVPGSTHLPTVQGPVTQPGALQPPIPTSATPQPVATPVGFTSGARHAHPAPAKEAIQRLESVTPGRAEAGSVGLPLSKREAIVERFASDDALLDLESRLQTGRTGTLPWPAARWHRVVQDLYRVNDTAQTDPAAAAAMDDIDWRGAEALLHMIDASPDWH